LLALQEVDSRRPDGGDPFEIVRRALDRHGVDARTIVTSDGDYGQMLFSRWPMEKTEVHDISFLEREPRRAIGACVVTPYGRMRVIATHLGLSLRERNSQLRRLLDLIDQSDGLTVLLGDFNDWIWAGSVRGVLRRVLPGRTRHRTYPSLAPLFRLDRVYCRPGRALISSFVDPRGRALSDHLPVIADLVVNDAAHEIRTGQAERAVS
jgi:endonuclease/exonuclease/phosphatase family metal-dependent hydrolase